MEEILVHRCPGLVEVVHLPELDAVWLRWSDEYDTGTAVRDAVLAAVRHVRSAGVWHWIGDISASRRGLSARDLAWVSGDEFREAILSTPLEKFVLIPPGEETGQDSCWLADWEANTLAAFAPRIDARLCVGWDEVRAFLGA